MRLFLAPLLLGFIIFGLANVASAQLQDNVPGSFLLFPKFDIRGDSSTQFRIANTGESNINVYIVAVCPGVKNINPFCAKLDTTIRFTPHQTRVIDVADLHPPCAQGYLTAYAYGAGGQFDVGGLAANNRPISYNHLVGSYRIDVGRTQESDNAIASQSPFNDGFILNSPPLFGFDYFGDVSALHIDFLSVTPSIGATPGSGSRLSLVDLHATPGAPNPPALLFVDFWNAAEVPFSSSLEFVCWTEKDLDAIDLNFLSANLGTSRGSMTLTPVDNCPLPGGCPPLIPHYPFPLGVLMEHGDGDTASRTLYYESSSSFEEGPG